MCCQLLLMWFMGSACSAGAADPSKTAEVVVTRPVVQQVIDYQDFTGRTEAVHQVQLRARVSGYLEQVLFRDGDRIKEGQVLFKIDARPYEAKIERARAAVTVAKAHVRQAQAELARAKATSARGGDATAVDKASAAYEAAVAEVHLAEADLKIAELNFDLTRVRAPMNGRIGRRLLDPGNIVRADHTVLAMMVSEDPMYACFDIDQRTWLRRHRLGSSTVPILGEPTPLLMGLADEQDFPHKGTVDFIDNHVDSRTGTLRVRGVFPNPQALLLPGLVVRLRLAEGGPHQALLVPASAIHSRRGRFFVLVVNGNDQIERRAVEAGSLHNGLQVITTGVTAEERIVTGKQQDLRPGMTVRVRTEAIRTH